jgi:PLP dependent protein
MANPSKTLPPADARTAQIIRQNWLRFTEQVEEACHQANRGCHEVRIVGVAKYVDAALTAQLVNAGCTTIGENRPQLLWEKHEYFKQIQLPMPSWHLIGHLQRNKVRRTLPLVQMIESVDSLRLAQELNAEAAKINLRLDILVDVNLTQDATKTGMTLEQLENAAEELAGFQFLNWRGLMAMSSLSAEESTVMAEFVKVREVRDRLQAKLGPSVSLSELSMGMSGDFRQAIKAGSTSVRIGSNLWTDII